MKAIVLAAGSGNRLSSAFDDPKCLIPIGGIPLLKRYLEGFYAAGIDQVVLVAGYRMEKIVEYIKNLSVEFPMHILMNKDYEKGSIVSLWTAEEWLSGDILLMDGDLYFERDFLSRAMTSMKQNFFLIDSTARNDGEAVMVGFREGRAVNLARGLYGEFDLVGEWAGGIKLSPEGTSLLRDVVCRQIEEGNTEKGYEFIVPQLFDMIDLSYELIDGCNWIEIDFPGDMEQAEKMDQGIRKKEKSHDKSA